MELKRAIKGAVGAAATVDEIRRLSRRPPMRETIAFIGQTLFDAGSVGETARRIGHANDVVQVNQHYRVDLRPDLFSYVVDGCEFR